MIGKGNHMEKAYKRFERGAEKADTHKYLALAGIDVFLEDSKLLFTQETFTQEELTRLFEVKSGQWWTEDGWIVGKNPKMCPGMIVSRDDFFGNVMVEITCQMVEPATHDVNVMINGEWNEELDCRGNAYVAGLEAFWHGNVGFEKSPEYKLTAATPFIGFDPKKEYKFQMGNIDGKVFVLVDGVLMLEITDPDPLDGSRYGKIGFEAYSSWWRFKDLKVCELAYEKITEYYNPEF